MTQSRQFRLIIEALLSNKPIFVKNTGIKVRVNKLEKSNRSRYYKMKTATCEITFDETPSYKALAICENYNYRGDAITTLGGPRQMGSDFRAVIRILNLSHRPFETKTSKALYDPKKS